MGGVDMGKMLDKLNEYLDNATQEELQDTYNKLSHLLCKGDVTIDERATEWAIANTGGVSTECRPEMITSFKMVYETIATEQEQITKKEMIDKACELKCRFCTSTSHTECIYRRNHGEPNLRCMEYGIFKTALEE